MSLVSVWFLIFALALLIVYYAIPGRFRWIVLLIASAVFYCAADLRSVVYIFITAVSTWLAALWMQRISRRQSAYIKENKQTLSREERSALRARGKRRRRWIMAMTLVLNFGILCVFKYAHFALAQISAIARAFGGRPVNDTLQLIVPLGISFYTFQTMGYLIDVYWERYEPERNFFRLALFVSFFPQITQGPISDYSYLRGELFTPHEFTYANFSRGFQRMLAGYYKKLVLANLLAPYVADVFAHYGEYAGVTVAIGAVCYSVQIYADFSGYMDIVCGLCEMLGIRLTENFLRPYFSKSVAEYWRRWHISLGAWFKAYLYYPIGVAKWNRRLGKRAQDKLGKAFGQTVSASVALVAVWLITGLWHGASWAYIAWGGVNGLFIIASLWLEPVFARVKKGLRIREDRWLWRAFQTLRTFALVTLIKVLPEVGTLSDGLGLWKRIFTNYTCPASLRSLVPFAGPRSEILLIAVSTLALFVGSLLQRKRPVRDYFGRLPAPVRVILLAALAVAIIYFGGPAAGQLGGFMYAQF